MPSVVNAVDCSGVDDKVVEESSVVEEGMVLVSAVVDVVVVVSSHIISTPSHTSLQM